MFFSILGLTVLLLVLSISIGMAALIWRERFSYIDKYNHALQERNAFQELSVIREKQKNALVNDKDVLAFNYQSLQNEKNVLASDNAYLKHQIKNKEEEHRCINYENIQNIKTIEILKDENIELKGENIDLKRTLSKKEEQEEIALNQGYREGYEQAVENSFKSDFDVDETYREIPEYCVFGSLCMSPRYAKNYIEALKAAQDLFTQYPSSTIIIFRLSGESTVYRGQKNGAVVELLPLKGTVSNFR